MTNPDMSSTNHPSDETLAAFVDDRLDAQSRKVVIEHIATCDDCRAAWETISEFTVQSNAENLAPNVTRGAFGRGRWVQLSAVAAAIAMGFLLWPFAQTYRNRDLLIEASAWREDRPSDARLSGDHPYKPAKRILRSDGNRKDVSGVYPALADIDNAARRHRTVENLRQLAAVRLLAEDWDEAVAAAEEAVRLETGAGSVPEAIQKSTNPALLNDVSAIYYARASRRHDAATDLAVAHDAAKRSLDLAKTPQALWNYAVALESLGLTEAARQAWNDYLHLDPRSQWSKEAWTHLEDLDSHAGAAWTEQTERRLRDALYAADKTNVRALVNAYRRDSRTFGEETLLGEWGDRPTDARLDAVALLAEVIEETSGDRLLMDTVASIRAASPAHRQRLATAHATYRTARAIALREPLRAFDLYASTAAAFDDAQSPFASLARIRKAGCLQRQFKLDQALRELNAVEPPQRQALRHYFGMAAHTEWSLASIYVEQGLPDLALKSFEQAQVWFHRLGETSSEAEVHARAAQAADMMGDQHAAFAHRLEALRLHSAAPRNAQQMILLEAGLGFSSAGYSQLPATVFDQMIARGRQENDLYITCAGLLWRSLHYATYGDAERAQRDYNEATAYCTSISDPAVRMRVQDTTAVVNDRITADTRIALMSLDAAIELAERSGSKFRRAVLYARRSQRHLEQGNIEAARTDARRAMGDFGSQLRNVRRSEHRASWVEASRELVGSRIDAEIAARDYGAAFTAMEWQHLSTSAAFISSDAAPPSVEAIQRSLAGDAALLEFHVGKKRLTTFVVRASGFTVHTSDVARVKLDKDVEELNTAIQDDDPAAIAAHAGALYTTLIRQAEPQLSGVNTIVIVPDGALAAVPFSLLRDSAGRRLLDSFTITTLPSAADLLSGSCDVRSPFKSVTVVAGARQIKAGELLLSDPTPEIQNVAALYSSVQVLRDNTATPETVFAAAESDALHYTGHALVNLDRPQFSALVLPGTGGGTRLLYAHQIAEQDWRQVRLVVLAGCSTGKRDGVIRATGSIAQAFLAGGVQSVIGTLWDVEDAASRTASLKIHELVHQGATPARAVRRMQQEMSKPTSRWRSPRTWAAWTAMGGCEARGPGQRVLTASAER